MRFFLLAIMPHICFAALSVTITGCGSVDPEVKKLVSDLTDDDPEERHDAAKALENIGVRAKPAVKALGRCLHDEDPKVRYRAAKTLAKMGKASQGAVQDLGQALADDKPKVKYYSAKALVEIADQDPKAVAPVIPQLIESLEAPDAKTRYYIVKALGKTGAHAYSVIAEIEKRINDSDENVRNAAMSAVKRIRKKHSES